MFREIKLSTVIIIFFIVLTSVIIKTILSNNRHNDIIIVNGGIEYIVNRYEISGDCIVFRHDDEIKTICENYKIIE